VKFLVDANLPPALARVLTSLGHQAQHVNDLSMSAAIDQDIAAIAIENDQVVITKDEDFVHIHTNTPKNLHMIWLRAGNMRKQALIDWFIPLLDGIIGLIETGNSLIEVRGLVAYGNSGYRKSGEVKN